MNESSDSSTTGDDPNEIVRPYRVLLPLFHPGDADNMLFLGEAFAQQRSGEFILAQVVPVSDEESISQASSEALAFRQELDALLTRHERRPTRMRSVVRVARDSWAGIWELVAEEEIDLLLLAWNHLELPQIDELIDRRLAHPPCDVVLARPPADLVQTEQWMALERILLPVRKSPNAVLSLRTAILLADAVDARVSYLHIHESESDREVLAPFLKQLKHLPEIDRYVVTAGDAVETILEEAAAHDAIILGAPTRAVRSERWTGTVLDAVAESTDKLLFVVKEREPEATAELTETMERRRGERSLGIVVDKWFAENTFHSSEFENIEWLVALKEEQAVSISLGLPALNEEETVGRVIRTCREALMEDFPLLDEIVLIDSDSTDETRQIARDLGVPVHIHQEILPEAGAHTGKGEALWKSLHVLQGDLIAWIDTDIKNIHPRFVYGILGPLLREERIQYVKGFYRRPLKQGDHMVAGGGGRVTELTARPLLNLFYPALSGVVQPLAGEYAGRRAALEQLPFFTGYGVETGLLIDLLSFHGLGSIAQSDLLERVHHNQPLPALSKMSFAIIQVVMSRLERQHAVELVDDANRTMNLVQIVDSAYRLDTAEIAEVERPPMLEIPAYRERRGLAAKSADES